MKGFHTQIVDKKMLTESIKRFFPDGDTNRGNVLLLS